MPIKANFDQSKVTRHLEEMVARQERVLVNTLSYVGERCVNKARTSGSYTDRTGNLRSSIGYVVAVDGQIRTMSDFSGIKSGGEGASIGQNYARELVSKFPQGIVLIVVAGMHYAKYVAAKGFDVIASAELEARNLVPKLLKQLTVEFTSNANSQTGTN